MLLLHSAKCPGAFHWANLPTRQAGVLSRGGFALLSSVFKNVQLVTQQ